MGIYPCISDGIVMKSSHVDRDVEYILSNYHSIGGNSGNAAEVVSYGYFSFNGSIVTETARGLRPTIQVSAQ